jgi:hypothetical protein
MSSNLETIDMWALPINRDAMRQGPQISAGMDYTPIPEGGDNCSPNMGFIEEYPPGIETVIGDSTAMELPSPGRRIKGRYMSVLA